MKPHSELSESLYIAVDLGAGSGRVFLTGLGGGELMLEEIRRFYYPPSESEGHLRWDAHRIFQEITKAARDSSLRAEQIGRPIRSIGIDSWGVDYGLVDRVGRLIEQPVCYRERRTEGAMDAVFSLLDRGEIFARTGIQFLVINTVFQLFAHRLEGIGDSSATVLLIPDLMNFFLTGRTAVEYTNATTTQLINATTRAWDRAIINALGLSSIVFPNIVFAGADLGPLKLELAESLGLPGVKVVAPATHDTASAVAGTPLQEDWAYISSGTWSLVGVERTEVAINQQVARHNFTNEGGAFGTIRFLKNVMGLWILECCRSEWKQQGLNVEYEELLAGGEQSNLIFPDDARFFNPRSMLKEIAAQLDETGQTVNSDPASVARTVLDSLAFRYASVVRTIEALTGRAIQGIHIVGGGSRNDYLNQMTANVTGQRVLAGPVEATVIGNALVQSIGAGRFGSLAAARHHVANNLSLKPFDPKPSKALSDLALKYSTIEQRYSR